MSSTSPEPGALAAPPAVAGADGLQQPERPALVPKGAEYVLLAREWEQAELDEEGRKTGLVRTWRRDGTLRREAVFRAGLLHGVARIYHPNGMLARTGQYEEGKAVGAFVAHASTEPSPEKLRACCVPKGAVTLRAEYKEGRLLEERFFDAQDRLLLSDGSVHPERPAGVPKEAWFEQRPARWARGSFDASGQREGLWEYWDLAGAPIEKLHYERGQRHGAYWAALGCNTAWLGTAQVVQGELTLGRVSGVWLWQDSAGRELERVDLGRVLSEEELRESPAFAESTPEAGWSSAAAQLLAEGRVAEALSAQARGAKGRAELAELQRLLAAHSLKVEAAHGRSLLEAVRTREGASLSALLDALLQGAPLASVLHALSSLLMAKPRAALELLEAALSLAGPVPEMLVTRALLGVELGDEAAARRDVALLQAEHGEGVAWLADYVGVSFAPFAFFPEGEVLLERRVAELADAPEQPLLEVQRAVQKYATRLLLARTELERRVSRGQPAPAWLPPDLSELLPQGPVELSAWQFEAGTEDEPDTVSVDERVDFTADGCAAIARQARADWVGLCWLCFAAGLGGVRWPAELAPCPRFAEALATAIERYWRCQDQRTTFGLRSRTQGVGSFVWRGMPLEQLSSMLLVCASEEYREMRAALFFMGDASCQSPFQDDLRVG